MIGWLLSMYYIGRKSLSESLLFLGVMFVLNLVPSSLDGNYFLLFAILGLMGYVVAVKFFRLGKGRAFEVVLVALMVNVALTWLLSSSGVIFF